ncbi:hypothetical protein B0A78_02665 [Flavobacterium columnare NBRC 100251 = ATCC 23463]|uniref:Uncharacterized protein n=1 Tax=Flavobacterium columnare (strain ATCC 49512 / CIP 103533 / TG 44/87) TaxID=1041826 RepID=G8XBP1_FLACA|nr:hypothetical protein FCOL_13305 [Flavobacterium columnare ATCC 49512]APT22570.1 hypothetical protein BU993_08005 [Flavobacterium columnare]PDS26185.1 hypothetical protein B0A78_02665 [Flavobacterium columnare NBRC 100251 = ATCC 23463]MBF6651884.1 hypothetical protein [Flavobacterium columnare]MBF6655459.1 hypothetical protein [Flavobacterium columnare]
MSLKCSTATVLNLNSALNLDYALEEIYYRKNAFEFKKMIVFQIQCSKTTSGENFLYLFCLFYPHEKV